MKLHAASTSFPNCTVCATASARGQVILISDETLRCSGTNGALIGNSISQLRSSSLSAGLYSQRALFNASGQPFWLQLPISTPTITDNFPLSSCAYACAFILMKIWKERWRKRQRAHHSSAQPSCQFIQLVEIAKCEELIKDPYKEQTRN